MVVFRLLLNDRGYVVFLNSFIEFKLFFLLHTESVFFCSPYSEKKLLLKISHLSCLTAFNTEKTKQGKLWTTYYSLLLIFFTTPVRW